MNYLRHYKFWGFITLMAISIFLRAYGLGFPSYHWDENLDFNNVFSASFNQLAILTYDHGSFHAYLILVIWHLYLFLIGEQPTTSNLILAYFTDPQPFLILARGLLVLASTGTVAMVFLVGKRLYNHRVGWIAAIFLAGTFLHAAESHYARTHVLGALFVILVLYFCSLILETGSKTAYMLAGVSLGLAAASQYSLVIAGVCIFYAHIKYLKNTGTVTNLHRLLFDSSLLRSVGVAAIAFFCVTPYAALDAQRFLKEISSNAQNVTRTWVDSEGLPVWLFYLTEHLRNGMGTLLALTSLLGFVYALLRRSQADSLLIVFLLVSYLTLANSANFARYLIPSLPILVILAALLLDRIFTPLAKNLSQKGINLIIVLFIVGSMIQPVINIIRFDYWLTQPDTRQAAVDWILSNIPKGSKFAIEGAGALAPNIPVSRENLEKLLSVQPTGTLGEVYTEALLTSQASDIGYTVLSVFRLDQLHKSGTFIENLTSASYYKNLGYEYLVTTSWMQRSSTDTYAPGFQASLNEYYEPIKVFHPTIYFRFDPYSWRIDYEALSKVVPGRPEIGGPILTIYRLRETK